MKRNSKLLSIIVIAILTVSFIVPILNVSALSNPPTITPGTGPYYVGDVLTVSRPSGEVTSGSDVRFYWDYVSGPDALLLNTTQGEPDGGYSTEITIPETYSGYHYIWVRDVETGSTISSTAIYVDASIEIDPTSGLPTDVVTAEAHAFNDSTEIWFGMFNQTAPLVYDWWSTTNLTTSPSTVETDDDGYAEADITIPSGLAYGTYTINCTDGINWAWVNFTIGPSLVIAVDEGPSGFQISFTGRGYNASDTIVEGEVFWDGWAIPIVGDEIDVDIDGDISGKVVAPTDAKGDHNLTVYDGLWAAYDMFKITGTSVIEVTPTYGPPGTTMTITGYNFTQIEDTNVDLTIGGTTLGSAMTEDDGTFTATATAPAKQFQTYNVMAVDDYGLNASDAYKIGILAMLFYPTSGDTGTNVTVTATGFNANGEFNVSLGDELVIQNGDIDVNETIFTSFHVPTMDPGTYQLSLIDDAGNELANPFVVTANTTLTPNINEAAVGYNVTFSGSGYVEENNTALTWYVYNGTWSMDISSKVNISDSLIAAFVDGDGNFTGVWTVPMQMLLGNTYWVNATDAEGLWAETSLIIVEEEVDIRPNKESYSLGDTVTFKIKATFRKADSYLELRDPNEELIYKSTFEAGDWTYIDPWQVVLVYNQVSDDSMNPFILPSDADIGTWTWSMYDDEDEVVHNGTIEVLPTTAAQVDARLTDVESSLSDLAEEVSQVSTDIGDDIAGLSDEIAGVKDDLDAVKSDLASDIAEAKASADAAAAAVGDLEATVSDIAATANSAKAAADSAKASADAAKDAADDAKTATSGLTTLVYGAIGASLIAALAAIVSLMQISRRIAG
jgi:uncharacterized protein YoxC